MKEAFHLVSILLSLGMCLVSILRTTVTHGNMRCPRNLKQPGVTMKCLVKTQPARMILISTAWGHIQTNLALKYLPFP